MTDFDPRANAQNFLNLPPPPGRTEETAEEPKPQKKRESLVYLRIAIPATAKRLLDDLAKREGVSYGQIAMRAWGAEKDRVLAAYAVPEGDPLASIPTRKRQPLKDPVTAALGLSSAQVAALNEFKEKVTLSVSAFLTECVERYCAEND